MPAVTHSSGHIRKRQYQPSITSFFAQRDANTIDISHLQRSTSPLSPLLPADTQASLLSVGMRVRKSVPEGYKTHKTLAVQEYPFPSTAPVTTARSRSSHSGTRTRELTPFCGLHKTGGWAAQESFTSSAPAVIESEFDDDDDMPGMIMSQGTLQSTQGSLVGPSSMQQFGGSKKRGYDEEVEDDLDAYFDDVEALERDECRTQVSNRPMARMKGTKAANGTGASIAIAIADDFEEADFLSPGEGMDVDSL